MLQKCCCMSLTTGAIILGVLGLISSIILGLGCILASTHINDVVKEYAIRHRNYNTHTYSTVDVRAIGFGIIGGLLVYFTLYLIACIFLIVGAVKRSHRYILPWLFLAAFGMVVYVFSNIWIMTVSANPAKVFLKTAVSFSIQLYCFYAMYSLSHQKKEDAPPVSYSEVATNT